MKCVWEHNGRDTLLYSQDYVGAYTRGESLEVAMNKMPSEISSYILWAGQSAPLDTKIEIVQEKSSLLQISDADSDVIFDAERLPLSQKEYQELKGLVMRSAKDFQRLFESIPDKEKSCNIRRKTFYGTVPRTAFEMYEHTKSVNSYYFGEIGITVDNEGSIFDCRAKGFVYLEQTKSYLSSTVFEGSYGEAWSLRKVMRRFLWHDRIHAKAMYRMAIKTFGPKKIENPFKFSL